MPAVASLSEPGALDEAQNMQQVLAWVMRDASAAAGGSAMMPEDSDGSSLPDVLGGAYDLDPTDADLAVLLEAQVGGWLARAVHEQLVLVTSDSPVIYSPQRLD